MACESVCVAGGIFRQPESCLNVVCLRRYQDAGHLAFANPHGAAHIPRPFSMNWISIITNLLTAVNLLVCILLILLVLLQRPKNEGLGAAFGGDTASNLFGAQTTNVLANLTRWMGGIFLAICLAIAILGTFDKDRQGKIGVYIDKVKAEKAERDKQKASEQAAKAAAEKAEAATRPQIPNSTTTEPVAVPPIPSPDAKPAMPATPTAPAPDKTKPADSKAPQPTPTESKPADVKPADAKPAEAKPADAKPADEKPAESKPPVPVVPPAPPAPGGNEGN